MHCSLCGSSFKKYNSFQRHVKRKHTLENQQDDPQDDEDVNSDDNFDGVLNDNENQPVNVQFVSHDEELQWNAAKYILTLKEKHGQTQTAVDSTLEVTNDLIEQVVNGVKRKLKAKLHNNGVNLDELLQDDEDDAFYPENDIFNTSFLFENVGTEYLQKKVFREKFDLEVSVPAITVC